jgi:hypothetical protein
MTKVTVPAENEVSTANKKKLSWLKKVVGFVPIQNFFDAGYTKGSLIDLVQMAAVMVVTNYLHN